MVGDSHHVGPSPQIGEWKNAPLLRWYALYLRSRYEKMVDIRLREREIETYLPMIEEIRQYSDRKKKVIQPLFRGYLFVRTDLRSRVEILETEGVVKFVGIGLKPSPIPDKQIECIRIAGGIPSKIRRESYLATGERVRVSGGPFEGLEGFILAVKGSMRVVVSVDCIGQSVSVEVTPDSVVKL
jgi:transcription elongation factor/antiterminator RfaH